MNYSKGLLFFLLLSQAVHELIGWVNNHGFALQACTSVDLPSEEGKTKMGHMSKMFQMYSTKEFINGVDLWLAGICRYINDAYASLAVKVCYNISTYIMQRNLLHTPQKIQYNIM